MESKPDERYAEFLARKGRRVTTLAARVVELIFSKSGTFDGEDIVEVMLGEASRATIYRAIAGLIEADLLRSVRFNGHDVYVAVAESDL